jgi:hypothetical protein
LETRFVKLALDSFVRRNRLSRLGKRATTKMTIAMAEQMKAIPALAVLVKPENLDGVLSVLSTASWGV